MFSKSGCGSGCGSRPRTRNTPQKHESVRKEWEGAPARVCQLAFTKTQCEPDVTQRRQKYVNLTRNKSSVSELLVSEAWPSTEKQDQEQKVLMPVELEKSNDNN